MDNLTHSLVGMAIADAAMPKGAPPAARRLIASAAILAANAPDVDLVYTAITPPPIGYLLHHRGHTHTVLGVAVLMALLIASFRMVRPLRGRPPRERRRLWWVIALGVASHLPLDALNSYGVHPYYPYDNGWYYGDAVFIFEPWIWLVLGIAVASNRAKLRGRLAAAVPVGLLSVGLAAVGIIPLDAFAALVLGAAALIWLARRWPPAARAAMALLAVVAIASAMGVVSRWARHATIEAVQPHVRGRLVDVVLTPNPSSPLCWAVIGVELNEPAGEYVMWRGTLSVAPALKDPATCASYRFMSAASARILGDGRLALQAEVRQPLARLRRIVRDDCWTRAWMQFGRAPMLDAAGIVDLRFARGNDDFTRMRVQPGRGCPPFLTSWAMPRADFVGRD